MCDGFRVRPIFSLFTLPPVGNRKRDTERFAYRRTFAVVSGNGEKTDVSVAEFA